LGDYRDYDSALYAVLPHYDTAVPHFAAAWLATEAGTYVDVGANVGLGATTLARALAGRATVLAIEPAPATARRAAATFALNGVTNVRLFQLALSDTDGQTTLVCPADFSGTAAVRDTRASAAGPVQAVSVPCRRLDTLLAEVAVERIGLIKIDVEGHELAVLRGARQTLVGQRPALLYEHNHRLMPTLDYTAAEVAAFLRSCGPYQFQVLHEDGRLTAFPPVPNGADYVNILAALS
jgi:FkbM family methyltransferase